MERPAPGAPAGAAPQTRGAAAHDDGGAARAHLPARSLPLLYLATGLLSLLVAFVTVAADPAGLAGFFYHPRMLAVVHLVTLGWIGGSVLGSIHIVGPLALRMPLVATRGDHARFLAFAVGVLGMVSHFWIDSPRGMVWSAGLATLAFLGAAARVLPRLWRAPIPKPAKVPVALAFVNIVLAAGLGSVLGFNKVVPILPVHHLQVVFAHAHLAAVGFATLIVMGAAYRLLPMMLPAAMTAGRGPLWSAAFVEAGTLGLVASFFLGDRGGDLLGGALVAPGRVRRLSAVLVAAGVLLFLAHVGRMLRQRRPAPPERPRPDWPALQALGALAWLGVTTALGLALAFLDRFDAASPLALAYGALGLVGFLAQIVVAVQQRILPLAAWLWTYAGSGYQQEPPSLHTAHGRAFPAATAAAWALGVPLLAAALACEWLPGLRAAGLLLLLGTLTHAAGLARTLRRLHLAPRGSAATTPNAGSAPGATS